MIIAGFDWDEGNWPKCGKHGLSQEDVERLFSGKIAIISSTAENRPEMRFAAIGVLDDIFVLTVFTIRAIDGSLAIRPISARPVRLKEIRKHEQAAGIEIYSRLRNR